ncbi:MAG: DsrE family protein [Proteobacteria bacterium]|nr:sulfur reduction protein DsrE [Desulfobacula sp.]MBU4130692.1 DsrE family protein [Pseudomonadota bacterium]
MTDNVLITIACGTDNPNRATRGLFLAAVAQRQGKNVTVFLLDEGVYLARKGAAAPLQAATGDSADDSLAHLQAHNVPILVCTPCAKSRFIAQEDLADSCRMATAGELIDIACDAACISL